MRTLIGIVMLAGATASAAPRDHGELVFADGHREARAAGVTVRGDRRETFAATADPIVAEEVARRFLAAHLDELAPGDAVSDFVVVANRLDDGIRSLGFEQRWRGLRVIGGQLGVVIAHDRVVAVLSQALPHVAAVLPRGRASGERVVMRIAGVDRIVEHRRDGAWDLYADDHGEVARQSLRRDASGTLEYDAGVRYASGTRSNMVARTAHITVDSVATTTSTTGTFSWAGASPATVAPSCAGTQVLVANVTGDVATSLMVQPGGGAIWNVANSELADAQVSTYVYGNLVADRAQRIDAATSAWLAPFVFHVNETNPCNAYYDTTAKEVHLARAAAGCENTGRVADIVFHEFGHALHDHEIILGMGAFQTALSEGLADFNAANLTEDPGIGRGLDYTDAPARDIDPVGFERVSPQDIDFDPHLTGEIVSGALWDLRKTLITELGHDPGVALTEQLFLGVMRRASDLPTSYTAALIADDDDGDLANGTPHGCAIQRAFGIHGLAPDFIDVAIGTPQLVDGTLSVPVTPGSAGACPPRRVAAMHVLWRTGDAVANDLDLVEQGAAWTGTLADLPEGTVVSYAIDVTLDDGTQLALPNNPADPLYQAFIGTATPLYCTTFDRDPATENPPWTRSGTVPNDWQWATPNALGRISGDPLSAHTGTHAYGTNLANGGSYNAAESVAVATPTIDTTAFQLIHLQYWRWLTVDDAQFDQARIIASTDTLWQNATTAAGTLAHVDREWRFQDLDLTPHLDHGSISVSWSLDSDATGERGGWTLDDVCIVGLTKLARCGDAFLDAGEQCDDGNTTSGDGCSAECVDEVSAGGGCATTGDGSLVVGIAIVLSAGAWRSRRARARVPGRPDRARRGCRSTDADRADRSRSST